MPIFQNIFFNRFLRKNLILARAEFFPQAENDRRAEAVSAYFVSDFFQSGEFIVLPPFDLTETMPYATIKRYGKNALF